MGNTVRAKISKKNKYYIDIHRYYELKHFCLQYPLWKKEYLYSDGLMSRELSLNSSKGFSDNTYKAVEKRLYFSERMEMVEQAAIDTSSDLFTYILKAVTEGLSYVNLRTMHDIPCSRDYYYNLYRRFFWILDNLRK